MFCGVPNGSVIVRDLADPVRWQLADSAPDGGVRRVRIVLTVAHLDHTTTNNADDNLASLCQRCHLRYDRFEHGANARRTRQRRQQAQVVAAGQTWCFGDDPVTPNQRSGTAPPAPALM